MRLIGPLLVLALGCSACEGERPPQATAAAEAPAPRAEAPAQAKAGPVRPGSQLPPAGGEFRYVGGWAATAQACAEPPWRFEARRLSTAGEVTCDFDRVTTTAAGYEIEATCVAQAPPEKHRLQLSFAESARAMMVEGGPFGGPIGLVWCGAG